MVIHSWAIPALAIKVDAYPGQGCTASYFYMLESSNK